MALARANFLTSIAKTIEDYRLGEIAKPNAAHVDRWIRQFPAAVQVPLLSEMDHVLKQTYLHKEWVAKFLKREVKNAKLAGNDPCAFWEGMNFLDIQQHGNSQKEMLELFDECLEEECGIVSEDCGSDDGPFIYLDDVLFSGSRIGTDLATWIGDEAPDNCVVHVLVIASHRFGEWKVSQRLKQVGDQAGKKVEIHIWRLFAIENRNSYRDKSELLWPAVIPEDEGLKNYMAQEKKFPFIPRQPGGKLDINVFSSEAGRQLLERELLLAGVRIREACVEPKAVMRPLGFSPFGLGFGSTIVTFRNCPNNCPLALWWGDPDADAASPLSKWYPLLQRKTYGANIDFSKIVF